MVREKIPGFPDRVSDCVEQSISDLKLPDWVYADIAEGAITTLRLFNVDLDDPKSQEAIRTSVETWAQFVQENLDGSENVEKMRCAVAEEIRWMYLGPSPIQERFKQLLETCK